MYQAHPPPHGRCWWSHPVHLFSYYSYPQTTPKLHFVSIISNGPGPPPNPWQVLVVTSSTPILRLLQSSDYTHSQTIPKIYYIYYFWLVQDYSQIILNFCIVKIITSEPHPTSDCHIHYNYSHFTPIPRLLPFSDYSITTLCQYHN